jgi:hypothetical protein
VGQSHATRSKLWAKVTRPRVSCGSSCGPKSHDQELVVGQSHATMCKLWAKLWAKVTRPGARCRPKSFKAKRSDEFGGAGMRAAVEGASQTQLALQPQPPSSPLAPKRGREHTWTDRNPGPPSGLSYHGAPSTCINDNISTTTSSQLAFT